MILISIYPARTKVTVRAVAGRVKKRCDTRDRAERARSIDAP
jgi:hypothetical protein